MAVAYAPRTKKSSAPTEIASPNPLTRRLSIVADGFVALNAVVAAMVVQGVRAGNAAAITPPVQQTPPVPVTATGVPQVCCHRAVVASNAVAVVTDGRYTAAWTPCTVTLGDWSRHAVSPADCVAATAAPAVGP